jgi:hypothetical protein
MKKALIAFSVIILLPINMGGAISSAQENKETKINPRRIEFEIGIDSIISRNKIDPYLPSDIRPVLISGLNLLNNFIKVNTEFQSDLNNSNYYKLTTDINIVKFKKIGIGPSVYFVITKEHDLFIKEKGLTADDFTEKNYGLTGFNIYNRIYKTADIRFSYMLGAAYIKEHGIFNFINNNTDSKEKIIKLYNKDLLPIEMFSIENGLHTSNKKIEIDGTFRWIKTKNIFDIPNTKKFIPPRQKILEGSIDIHLRTKLYISFSGTLTDSKYSPVLLGGNTFGSKLKLKF